MAKKKKTEQAAPVTPVSFKDRYAGHVLNLSAALEAGDEEAFHKQLHLLAHERDDAMWTQLRKLTSDLHGALERFQLDSRLVDLAEKEVPDAKQRLDYVLKMTDEAAHKTMDLVDQSAPLAGVIAKQAGELSDIWQRFNERRITPEEFRDLLASMTAFLALTRTNTEAVRSNLNEVLMTQGYQDLSGQIIRGVIKLVGEVEGALTELVDMALSEKKLLGEEMNDQFRETRGYGPVVPGVDHGVVVAGQNDVDDLLSNLGM